jgi:hypothetical protein
MFQRKTTRVTSVEQEDHATPSKLGDLWFTGPVWLSSWHQWPKQPEISETKESAEEEIPHKLTLAMTEVDRDKR